MRTACLMAALLIANACHAIPSIDFDTSSVSSFSVVVVTDSPGSLAVELLLDTTGLDKLTAKVNESLFDQPNPGANPLTGGETTGLWLDQTNDELFISYGSSVVEPGTFELLQIEYELLGSGAGCAAVSGLVAQGGVNYDMGVVEIDCGGDPSTPGDFDGNGSVGDGDLTLLLGNWGAMVPPVPFGWEGYQPTAPTIGDDELTALLNNWGVTNSFPAAVPEPAASLLAAIGVAVAFVRRRAV